MNLNKEKLDSMKELEIIKVLNDPKTDRDDYNLAFNYILERYKPMIGKHWGILCRQMNNSVIVRNLKDEYYSMAYEALYKVIHKVDFSVLYDDNYKIMQLFSWYLTNVRNKLIPEVRKRGKKKGLSNMGDDVDLDSTIDIDVEEAYWRAGGYKEDPAYEVIEIRCGEEICEEAISTCLNKWSDREKLVFRYLQEGQTRNNIAKLLNLSTVKIWSIINKMKKDIKKELGQSA